MIPPELMERVNAWSIRHPRRTATPRFFMPSTILQAAACPTSTRAITRPWSCGVVRGSFQVFRLETGGPVIGLLRTCAISEASFLMKPGDLVVLFTDGVSESMNVRFEEWGEERLIEFAKTCYGLPALEGMRRILAAAQAFAAGASQHDDMTLVVLRFSR